MSRRKSITMTRQPATGFVLLVWLTASASSVCYAQGKKACDLLTKADVESVLGVALQEPYSPRSGGKILEGHCTFTNENYSKNPSKVVYFNVDVSYSPAPNPAAVEQWLKDLDENPGFNTAPDPVEVPGVGDAAFMTQPWGGALYVFKGGTMTLSLSGSFAGGQSTSGFFALDQIKALALKALGGPAKTGYVYGTRIPLSKPVLGKAGTKLSPADQLKHDLTAKAEAGDAKAQLVLGNLYQFGTLGANGSPQPDYAGAAYWYQQAADKGVAYGAYRLALLYRDGLGVTADRFRARQLLRKAGISGYVPAMALLASAYLDLKNANGQSRAAVWARKAADTGDPQGWFTLGYINYYADRPRALNDAMYRFAMENYRKAADGGYCAAMLNIGGLYFNGQGVPQDAKQAQSWFTRAEACDNKNLDGVREKAAKYRERAAKGYLPAVVQTAASGISGWAGMSDGQKVLAGLVALTIVGVALEIVAGPSSNDSTGYPTAFDNWMMGRPDQDVNWLEPGTGFGGQRCWGRGSLGCT